MTSRFADHILKGTTAARPSASSVPAGTIYASSSDGTIYQSDGTSWGTWLAAPSAATTVANDTLWDAKGDLAVGTGADTAAKLTVGSNGQVLTADSTQTSGVKWAAASGGGESYYFGTGAPSSGTGAVGDVYQDTATGKIYEKQSVVGSPTFRSAVDTTTTNTTSHSISMPAGVVAGDTLVMIVTTYGATPVGLNTPSGWTKLLTDKASTVLGNRTYQIFARTADGTEGASVAMTSTSAVYTLVSVLAYSGANGIDLAAAGTEQNNTGAPTFPSLTSTVANDLALDIYSEIGGPSADVMTAASGWTMRRDSTFQSSGGLIHHVMEKALPSAGASGAATASISNSSSIGYTYAVAIKSSGASTPTWVLMYTPGSSGAMTQLYSSTLSSAAASFDVSSISGSYTHLMIVCMVREDAGGLQNFSLRLNNDSGSNYDRALNALFGANPTFSAAAAANLLYLGDVVGAAASANVASYIQLLIPYYAGTTFYKTVLGQVGGSFGTLGTTGSYEQFVISGLWRSTSAVNRITLFGGNNLMAGSALTIYGVT